VFLVAGLFAVDLDLTGPFGLTSVPLFPAAVVYVIN